MRNVKYDSISGLLVEAAPEAMLLVDADGELMLVNDQMERLFGYDRSELLGQNIEMLVPEAARATHPGHRADYTANPSTRPMGACMQVGARRKDGTEFPAEVSLSAFTFNDELIVSAIVRDITARLAEAQTRQILATVASGTACSCASTGPGGWRAWANSRAASRMTSTTSWR